jgi:site-specific DNA recombinase
LEAGADPAVVAAWIQEEQAKKVAAEGLLRSAPVPVRTLSRDDLAESLRSVGDLVRVLGRARPERRACLHGRLGMRLIYHPSKQKVLVRPAQYQDLIGETNVSEGGLEPPPPCGD